MGAGARAASEAGGSAAAWDEGVHGVVRDSGDFFGAAESVWTIVPADYERGVAVSEQHGVVCVLSEWAGDGAEDD